MRRNSKSHAALVLFLAATGLRIGEALALICQRFALIPEQVIYIDDLQHNVEAASRIGMHAIRFSDPASLREELVQLGFLPSKARVEYVPWSALTNK